MKQTILSLAMMMTAAMTCQSADRVEGVHPFPFQGCEILCIQDASMKHPAGLFADAAKSGYRPGDGAYESSVNVFLLRESGRCCLIDAGLDQTRGAMAGRLRQAGVAFDSISDVFITHIHPDHVGGLLLDSKPIFPKATLHIAREEYEAWEKDAARRALAKYLTPYASRLHLFEFGKELPFGLAPEKRGGHTPGHTIFRKPLGGGKEAIFVGDIVHAVALQFPHPTFCARYDAVPSEAVESRIRTLRMAGIFFGAHFPFPGAAQGGIVQKPNPDWAFKWQPFSAGE